MSTKIFSYINFLPIFSPFPCPISQNTRGQINHRAKHLVPLFYVHINKYCVNNEFRMTLYHRNKMTHSGIPIQSFRQGEAYKSKTGAFNQVQAHWSTITFRLVILNAMRQLSTNILNFFQRGNVCEMQNPPTQREQKIDKRIEAGQYGCSHGNHSTSSSKWKIQR